MAQRKVRRVKREGERPEADWSRPVYSPPTPSTAAPPPPDSTIRQREASEEELRETYSYVLQDLRRMALVIALIFLLLLVLGLAL